MYEDGRQYDIVPVVLEKNSSPFDFVHILLNQTNGINFNNDYEECKVYISKRKKLKL